MEAFPLRYWSLMFRQDWKSPCAPPPNAKASAHWPLCPSLTKSDCSEESASSTTCRIHSRAMRFDRRKLSRRNWHLSSTQSNPDCPATARRRYKDSLTPPKQHPHPALLP